MEWKFENGRIYSVDENNELMAEATYVMVDDTTVDVDHTYVNPSLRGQGVAGAMMKAVADFIRENGWKAVASCSYANSWFLKNKELYSDIIAKQLEEQAMACRIDGRH